MQTAVRVHYSDLLDWAVSCLVAAGAVEAVAQTMAHSLIQGDLLGFRTHGIRRLPFNVKQLVTKAARGQGEVKVIQDRVAVSHWDAEYLPGLYVMPLAVKAAIKKAKSCGTGTIIIKKMEHVASLAAYLEAATSAGMLIQIMVSTPAQSSVAPYGATSKVFSPNPFAVGVPSTTHPFLFDMSLSVTAAGKVRQAYDQEELLPWDALIQANGQATKDPSTYFTNPGSALMPLGGLDLGYKGYGLCLMSEIWTMALSNYGRQHGDTDGECNTAFIQVLDPSAFGEQAEFLKVTDDLFERCRHATPINKAKPVRIPGEQALKNKASQMAQGVIIDVLTWRKLQNCSERLEIKPPKAFNF